VYQYFPPLDHSIPRNGLTLMQAHAIMQTHIDCPLTCCPIKLCAKVVLVRNGHLCPADRPKFGF